MKKIVFPLCAFLILLASSCSGRIDAILKNDGSATTALETSLEPQMTVIIQNLSRIFGSGAPSQGPLIDGPSIGAAMAAAPGISSAELRNLNPSTIAGTIGISRIDSFLATSDSQAVEYDPAGSLLVSIDKQAGMRLLALMSPEVYDYLLALMAPVATGEAMSKRDYLALVMSLYGQTVADEIAKSQVIISLETPRPVKTIQGGTYQDRKAQFTLALADLLVLERPLNYALTW